MDRRSFLASAVGALGLAGCTALDSGGTDTPEPVEVGDEPESTERRTPTEAATQTPTATEQRGQEVTRTATPTESPTPTETPSPTATATPANPPAHLEIVDATFVYDEFARIDVENATGNYHGYADVDVSFLDEEGETIDEDRVNVRGVPGNAVWRAYAEYNGDATVDAVEASFDERTRTYGIAEPDGAEITDSSDPETDIIRNAEVDGTVEIHEEYTYLEVLAAFYDADGYFRDTGRDTASYVEPDTTWEFHASASMYPPDDAADITDCDLVLTT